MATTQMNVRIDADVKRRGDQAFARIGLSPTDVVRKAWEFAARNELDEAALREALAQFDPPEDIADRQRKLDRQEEFLRKMDEWRHSMGIDVDREDARAAISVDYRELLEDEWTEKGRF